MQRTIFVSSFLLFLLIVSGTFAKQPNDTLFTHLQTNSFSNSIKVPVGVWHPTTPKSTRETIVWFHGGMTSGNCEKGLVAGSDIAQMLPRYIVVSPSACKQNHWVEPTTIQALDNALDSLAQKNRKSIEELSLFGISDGSLGVIAYSMWGKRKIKNRILMSSYGEALGPAAQVAGQFALKNGRWRFIQGGSDRLYPSEKTLPWIQEFCNNVGTACDLKYDPQGEHDWSYWQNKHKEWILEFFSK